MCSRQARSPALGPGRWAWGQDCGLTHSDKCDMGICQMTKGECTTGRGTAGTFALSERKSWKGGFLEEVSSELGLEELA